MNPQSLGYRTCGIQHRSSEVSSTADEKFSMVANKVTYDVRLRHVDVRVYNVLAGCRRGDLARIGQRLIAKYACTDQKTVASAIKRLQSAGHLVVNGKVNRKRTEYRLTYAKFAGKAKPAETPIEEPIKRQRVELAPCSQCRGLCRPSKTGWCRKCATDGHVERISRRVSREEIARVKLA